jgi:acyl carrier protein
VEQTQIFDKVSGILKKYSKSDEALASLSMETSILEDLKVNSARLVDIVLDFEDNFEIEVEDEDADKVRTVGDAVTLISSKLN